MWTRSHNYEYAYIRLISNMWIRSHISSPVMTNLQYAHVYMVDIQSNDCVIFEGMSWTNVCEYLTELLDFEILVRNMLVAVQLSNNAIAMNMSLYTWPWLNEYVSRYYEPSIFRKTSYCLSKLPLISDVIIQYFNGC